MIGTEIGSYRIIEKLGEGGMGVVYKGLDTSLDRPVAIKVLSSSLANNPELVERFRSEARAQANLNHTNLATLYTFLVNDGSACMVMEFVDGETFENMIMRRGPIPALEAIPLFKQAMLGIGYAHRAGIVHRDIKPSNLMVNRFGIVKVMDFGIAKVMGQRGMTKTGTQMGTGWYMSPEQVLNKPVDIRSDIYSLGVTLYQMLSANVPFNGSSDFEIMSSHIQAPPPLPTQFYPYIPKGIENAVMKALEKNPSNRFQTVEEFGAALEHPDDFAFTPTLVATAAVAASPQSAPAASPAPARAAATVADVTSTMIMPPPTSAATATIPAQPGQQALSPAKPAFGSTQTKVLAGSGVLVAALVVGWFTLREPAPKPINTGGTTGVTAPSGQTPLEQQLTGGGGTATMSTAPSALKVDAFRTDKPSIAPGQKVHLAWSVAGASEVTITPGIGTVKAQGEMDVPVGKTTEFVLTAKNDQGGSVSSSTKVIVEPATGQNTQPPAKEASSSGNTASHPAEIPPAAPPQQQQPPPQQQTPPPPPTRIVPVISFQGTPERIPAGGIATLSWSITNAQSANIQPAPGVLRQANGQIQLRPQETTTYTLTATSKDGSTATSMVTIQVAPAAAAVVPPPQQPAGRGLVIGVVVHDHGATFGQNNVWNRCWGQMQVAGDHLQYRVIGSTDGRRDDFDIPLNQVSETAANRIPIRQQPAFHVTIGGQHFNFIPQGFAVVQAVSAIQQQKAQGR